MEIVIGFAVCFLAGMFVMALASGSEVAGRLEQHRRDLEEAWLEADVLKLKLEKLTECQREGVADLALAYDRLVRERDQVLTNRADAWAALHLALKVEPAAPPLQCRDCGDSIGKVDDQCFVCGLHDYEVVLDRPHAQA